MTHPTLYPWLLPAWQQLQHSREQGRLHHALLIHGPRGIGKRQLATAFAQALLCQRPQADGQACGQCRACHLFHADTHPDWLVLQPQESSKLIRVDQIRQLRDFLAQTAQLDGRRVVMLQPAEAMNSNAANSLLKTLEEPNTDCFLLLLCERPAQLMPTVRSRCQLLPIHKPEPSVALAWLGTQGVAQPETALALAAGAPLQALRYSAADYLQQRRQSFQAFTRLLLGQLEPLKAAEQLAQAPTESLLEWLLSWHQDLLRLKMVPDTVSLANADLASELQRLTTPYSAAHIAEQLKQSVALYGWRSSSLNWSLQLEAFCCGWMPR